MLEILINSERKNVRSFLFIFATWIQVAGTTVYLWPMKETRDEAVYKFCLQIVS